MTNRLKAYVRVKPFYHQRSIVDNVDDRPIIDIIDDRSLVFDPIDPEREPTDTNFFKGKQFKIPGVQHNKNSQYSFDGVFGDRSTNKSIFEAVTRPMVDAAIEGYNCSVFAYGATGSGKTHTMLGKPTNPGVIYYTTKDLFEKLSIISDTDPLPAELKICYFEIYNEKVRDLLVFAPNNFFRCGNKKLRTTPERCRARSQGGAVRDAYNLPVCEAPGDIHSLVIPDLTYHTPENAEQLIELLEAGNANRSQHPTDANADSSRSHAIFQIILTRRTSGQNGSEYKLRNSKMSLIDLAGSERASVAYRSGNNRSKNLQREGGNINKSLLALGNCINALAAGHKHIPYRNSKLTRLLKDSLGGKCQTAMIATVCQQPSHYDDTKSTLGFASRAKVIKTEAGRNSTDVAIQPKNYSIVIENQRKQNLTLQSENDKLQKENEELKRENQKLQQQLKPSPATIDRSNPNSTFIASEKTKKPSNFLEESHYGPKLAALYEERGNIKIDILRYESKYRMNQLKLTFKQLDELRQMTIQDKNFTKMNGNSTFTLATGLTGTLPINIDQTNFESQSHALRAQLKFYEQERTKLLGRVDANEDQINSILSKMSTEFVMRGYGTSEDFDATMRSFIIDKERIQELEEKKICEQHAYDLAQQGFSRLMGTEDLLNEAAHVIRDTHAIAEVRGFSEQMVSYLSNSLKKLGGQKSLVWKDDKYEMENNKANGPLLQLSSIHDNFSLNFLTPFRNNNTLHSRRLSKNLVKESTYTPEHSNMTFDASQ